MTVLLRVVKSWEEEEEEEATAAAVKRPACVNDFCVVLSGSWIF